MISRLHLTVIVAIAVATIAITRLVAGEKVSLGWFTSIGVAVAVNMAVLTAFDRWVWRWNRWQGWLVKRPHLWGEWDATIDSHWEEKPGSGKHPDPIQANLSIRQTYTGLHARLQTPESKGDLVSSKIVENNDGRYRLTGIYRNEPDLSVRDRSSIHNGAFVLEIEGNPNLPTLLKGHYWTDRLTKGEMTAIRR